MLELCSSLAEQDSDVSLTSGFEEPAFDQDIATESYADSEPTEVVDEAEAADAQPRTPQKSLPELLFDVRVYLKYRLYERAVDALSTILDAIDDPEPDDDHAFIDIDPEDNMSQVRSSALIKLLRLAEQTTKPCLFVLYDHFVNRRAAFVAAKGRICFGAHLEEKVYADDEFAEARPQLHARLKAVPDDDLRAAVALAGEPGFDDARADALLLMARAFCSMASLFDKPIRVDQTQVEEAPPTLRFKPYELLLATGQIVDEVAPDAATEFFDRYYDEAPECALVWNGSSRAPMPTRSKSVRSRSLEDVLVFAAASRSIRHVRARMEASPDSAFVILDGDGFWACVTTHQRTALTWFPITSLGRITKTLTELTDRAEPGPAPSPDIERAARTLSREGRR